MNQDISQTCDSTPRNVRSRDSQGSCLPENMVFQQGMNGVIRQNIDRDSQGVLQILFVSPKYDPDFRQCEHPSHRHFFCQRVTGVRVIPNKVRLSVHSWRPHGNEFAGVVFSRAGLYLTPDLLRSWRFAMIRISKIVRASPIIGSACQLGSDSLMMRRS